MCHINISISTTTHFFSFLDAQNSAYYIHIYILLYCGGLSTTLSDLFFRGVADDWRLDKVVSPRQVAAIDFIGHPLCAP